MTENTLFCSFGDPDSWVILNSRTILSLGSIYGCPVASASESTGRSSGKSPNLRTNKSREFSQSMVSLIEKMRLYSGSPVDPDRRVLCVTKPRDRQRRPRLILALFECLFIRILGFSFIYIVAASLVRCFHRDVKITRACLNPRHLDLSSEKKNVVSYI